MAIHDTIGDFLTMIRNASSAGKPEVRTRFSKMRKGILNILKQEGYIADHSEGSDDKGHKWIALTLKYDGETPAITGIERYSKPGRRLYFKSTNLPKILGGLGIGILTTSKGVMDERSARQKKLGGELICKVW